MGHFFGIGSGARPGTAPYTVNPGSGYGDYLYRRSDDYYCAFLAPVSFGRYFNPLAANSWGLEFGDNEEEATEGTVKTIWASRVASGEGMSMAQSWGGLTGKITSGDSRVTFNVTTDITTADFLPAVPARRFEITQLFLQGSDPSSIWYFKPPLPLQFNFLFEDDVYNAKAIIPFNATSSPTVYAGRFVHEPTYYGISGPGGGATCAVDGTHFTAYAEEQAHNSLSFTLGSGATSRAFNETETVASFLATSTGGTLAAVSNSEVAGSDTARAYFPAIGRITATFTEAGRLRVDCSSTISPTANVIGIYVQNGARGAVVNGLAAYIDHYEVDGEEVAGPYIPATVFDIVFAENGTAIPGYLTLCPVVDSDVFPPTTAAIENEAFPTGPSVPRTAIAFNYLMSVPAMIYAEVEAAPTDTNMLVRPSGEIKTRADSYLWQHRGGLFYAGDLKTGGIYNSTNEGGSWTLISNAWTGVSGASRFAYTSLPRGGAISIAKVGSDIKSRYSSDCKIWEDPVTVCPAGTTGRWTIASHEYSGSDAVSVMNLTTNQRFDSAERGAEGSWQEVTE